MLVLSLLSNSAFEPRLGVIWVRKAFVERMPSLLPTPPVLRVREDDSCSMPAPIDSLLKFQSTFSPLIISTILNCL